jgi:drug/metabolite transporter (DMT)-like permease
MSMILWGWRSGERPSQVQGVGFFLALGGLIWFELPGVEAPQPLASALMLGAGVAWGVYSLRGRGAGDPLQATAGNFLRALPMALLASAVFHAQVRLDVAGVGYALVSGALTSGVGYAIWYAALRGLDATRAATVQLSVPILAALAGALLLQESPSSRLLIASLAILGGIALVIRRRPRPI